jgi:LmbE family N-acetylglucosaminyl deacetylase
MNRTADAVVIFAHPDDAEFGAAGTVARWTREGREVVYVACTSGEKGTGDRAMSPERLAKIREREQREAARILGVREVHFLGHPDQGLEDTPDSRKEIVRLLRLHRPRIVLTSDPTTPYRDHRDHRIVGRVTMDAVYPYVRDHLSYPDLLDQGFEPHKVQEVWFWGSKQANHRVDITGTFELKIAALRAHASQLENFEEGALEAWVRKSCEEKARGESFALAEAFHREVIGL